MVLKKNKYLIKSDIDNLELTKFVKGFDEKKQKITTKVIHEKPLTIYLNNQEIVTLMSIGDHPKYLATGYLLNQNMLKNDDKIKSITYENDIETIIDILNDKFVSIFLMYCSTFFVSLESKESSQLSPNSFGSIDKTLFFFGLISSNLSVSRLYLIKAGKS